MIDFLWRTDVHQSDVGPVSRTDDWAQTVLNKLEEVGRLAIGCAAVLDGGDFFHIKSPSRNSHNLVQRTAAVHLKYPCPTLGNVGNHCVKYGDMSFLPESPLGVLFETGVFKRCYDEHEHIFTGDDGTKVQVVGVPYHGTTYDLDRFRMIQKRGDYLVVMGHQLASQEGGSMFEGEDIISYKQLQEICPQASVFLFGHWHKNQGVVTLPSGQVVVNVGSMTRGSLSQDEVARVPEVVRLSFTKAGFSYKQIPLTVSPPEDVFDMTGRKRAEQKESVLSDFADRFKETLQATVDREDIPAMVRGMKDLDPEIRELALSFLGQ